MNSEYSRIRFILQAEGDLRNWTVTGVQTCAFTISSRRRHTRSEDHTSELQSLTNLVCRLLLEKKNKRTSSAHERSNVTSSLEFKLVNSASCDAIVYASTRASESHRHCDKSDRTSV